jgi:hypothetical protein
MEPEKIVMYDSDSAARYVENVKGWVDINNRFWGDSKDSENMARYSSHTHKMCECGELMKKGRTKCEKCREKAEIERYNKLPFREYDGGLVYSHYADKWFSNSEEIEDYCDEENIKFADLRLVFGKPERFSELSGDMWDEVLPEDSDGELPKKLQEALDALNKVISELPPVSYSPDNVRTNYVPRP